MKKFLRAVFLLLVLGGLAFAALKFKLIPNPFDHTPTPDGTPTPALAARDQLRVAVASRPEKLLMSSLKKLLEVENLQLEVVDYNPDTVWLQLSSQEIDLVIAPVGEAVQAQGRFESGRFLFFTGVSVGLDELLAQPTVKDPKRVGIYRQAGTEFLARKMLPKAAVVPAQSWKGVENWLQGQAVDAALIDTSTSPADFQKKFKVLTATSLENPMPTVAVLSGGFADNADKPAYKQRMRVLEAAIGKWDNLVGYLQTQPELLKTTLEAEATTAGVDIDRMLAGYRFLSPHTGRTALLLADQDKTLEKTLDLLVISGVQIRQKPNWDQTIAMPAPLSSSIPDEAPVTPPTPDYGPTPEESTTPATASPTPEMSATPANPATEPVEAPTYPGFAMTVPWPEPVLNFRLDRTLSLPPALSPKQVAVATEAGLTLHEFGRDQNNLALPTPISTPVLFDGQNFVLAGAGLVWAVNSQGKEVWRVETQGVPLGAARVWDGKLFYLSGDDKSGQALCLDKVDGEVLWTTPLDSVPVTRPVLAQGATPLVVFTTKSGEMRALDATTGREAWRQKLDAPAYIDLGAGYGKIALVMPDGIVHLFSAKDGKQVWQADMGTGLIAPPTVVSRGVLVPSKDTYLYQLKMTDGSISWKQRLSQPLSEPAVVVDDKVLQSDEGGSVHVLQLSDGALLDSESVGKAWVSRVVINGNRWAVLDSGGGCRVYDSSKT